jgi:hypothetical protein
LGLGVVGLIPVVAVVVLVVVAEWKELVAAEHVSD